MIYFIVIPTQLFPSKQNIADLKPMKHWKLDGSDQDVTKSVNFAIAKLEER